MKLTTKSDLLKPGYRRGSIFMAMLVLLTGANSATAQSQDRDNPTALSSNVIKGTGTGKKAEYYYSFSTGAGELVITIDLQAKAGATSAEIELFAADSSKLFYYYPNATTQNERAVKRLNLSGKQVVTLRLALDSSAGDYAIKLAGPVEFAAADTSAGAATTPDASAGATSTPSPNAVQPTPTESTPQTDASAAAVAPPSVATPGKGSKVDLGINLLQTVGTHFALPTSGILHIVMKDGMTQEIDLSQVKSANLKKQ
ncbi:MAG: hypothetical protein QOI77_116 [Blastocatellia bacterium]|nr:hypothetical protein [Blastocatellia bacterium]